MNYVLENSRLKVQISALGAELKSIVDKKSQLEYLWQGDNAFWGSSSPVLFPICGRLVGGKYLYRGKEYQMYIHGFIKDSILPVKYIRKNALCFYLASNESTRKIYPFEFESLVIYKLKGASLSAQIIVLNPANENLYFSCGFHPGFNIPIDGKSQFNEHYVEFKSAKKCERLIFNNHNFYTGENLSFALEKGKRLKLDHNLFKSGPVFLRNTGKRIKLASVNSKKCITIKHKNAQYLGLWHTPNTNAPFVCVEPWWGAPAVDNGEFNLENKLGIIKLKPKKSFNSRFTISVKN